MWRKWVKVNWKRLLVIIGCLGLVVVRQIWPHLQFDILTLWLIAIAAVFLLVPDFRIILPYIKRIKLWEAEIELKEKVEELGNQVENVQNSVSQNSGKVTTDVSNIVNEVTSIASKSPKAALLELSSEIERLMYKRLQDQGVDIGQRYMPLPQAIVLGEKAGIFPTEIGLLVRDFWNVRNKVAHGIVSQDENSTTLSLIFTGIDILKLLAVNDEKGRNKGNTEFRP